MKQTVFKRLAACVLGVLLSACGGGARQEYVPSRFPSDAAQELVSVPQSETLYVGSYGGDGITEIDAYDIVSGAKMTEFHTGLLDGLIVPSNDRRHLIWETFGNYYGLAAWDWATQRYATSYTTGGGFAGGFAVSGDGLTAFQAAIDFGATTETEFTQIMDMGGCPHFLCNFRYVSAFGFEIAVDEKGNTIYVPGNHRLITFDVHSNSETKSLKLPDTLSSLLTDYASNQIYGQGAGVRKLYVIDLGTNTLRGYIFEDRGPVSAFTISRDGHFLYTASGSYITRYTIESSGRSTKTGEYHVPWPATFTNLGGPLIVSSTDNRYVFLSANGTANGLPVPPIQIDTATGKIVRYFPLPTRNYQVLGIGER